VRRDRTNDDGCELLLTSPGGDDAGGGGALGLSLPLARVLDRIDGFPGAVLLLAHMGDASAPGGGGGGLGLSLHRDLTARLAALLQFEMPSVDARAELWRQAREIIAPQLTA